MPKFFRWRFSLRTLLLISTIFGAGIGLYFHYKQHTIVGLARYFALHGRPMLARPAPVPDYDELKRELLKRMTSRELLTEVLSDPKIASLPIVKAKADPVAWLSSRLEVEFPGDSEILVIRLNQRKYREDAEQGIIIVNALLDRCYRLGHEEPFEPHVQPTRPWKWSPRLQIIEQATLVNR